MKKFPDRQNRQTSRARQQFNNIIVQHKLKKNKMKYNKKK